jgi:acyl-CoA synthetase (AMP-forming)/AMP-acid ligase II
MTAEELLAHDFGLMTDVLRAQAQERPDKPALIDARRTLTYAALDSLIDRVASALQRDGIAPGEAVAFCVANSVEYIATVFGVLRAGAVSAPLATTLTADTLAIQLADCAASIVFVDAAGAQALAPARDRITARLIALDGSAAGETAEAWMAPAGAKPQPVEVPPDQGFNIIYSSGTTGTPKGIVQPHRMRWSQFRGGGYGVDSVTMVSTPSYSNATFVPLLPTLARGGTVVLMPKFDADEFLRLSELHRATQTLLVPVQYRTLMQHPNFDDYDLSSYRLKFCTSAPFPAALKAEVVRRWPGGLVEFYGMTEGGGTCALRCHAYPDKLHTVGKPQPGHDVRLIDEQGREVAAGELGEVVGRSNAMMVGYHNQPGRTADAEWTSPEGLRFIRTGDVGRFDEDGFLILMDRKKDMIISGGFNIYPSDIEAELARHPEIAEAAVVGVPSERWGETPVAFVALKPGHALAPDTLMSWLNGRVGDTQRLSDLKIVEALPRSAIGKVLKRELRDAYAA